MADVTKVTTASGDVTHLQKVPQISGDLYAGEALGAVAACYIKASDGKVYQCNGTAANEAAKFDGFTARAVDVGQPVTLYGIGARFKYGSALTIGADLYISATPGALADAATTGGVTAIARVITATDIRVIKNADSPVLDANPTFANVTLTGLLTESAASGLTAAAGGTQAAALALTAEVNRVTTVATAADSVKLPPSAPGLTILVINQGANPMQVFGAGTDTIDAVATATGVSQMPNSVVMYICAAAGLWQSEGLSTGFSGQLQTMLSKDSITAFATGGQGSAVQLAAMINRISVCATAGDSVKLPVSAPGLSIVVINDGATSCNVFGQTGETINTLAANAAFPVPAGQTVTFTSTTAGAWQTTPAQIQQPVKWTQDAQAGASTTPAGAMTGANKTIINITAVGAANYTTRTAALMIADGALKIGQTWEVEIVNTNAGQTTLVGGVGVTVTGTATIAQNISRRYVATVTGAATITLQEVGSGAQ